MDHRLHQLFAAAIVDLNPLVGWLEGPAFAWVEFVLGYRVEVG